MHPHNRDAQQSILWGDIIQPILTERQYLERFEELQRPTIEATNVLIEGISPGQSEKQIADRYYKLLEERGFKEHWYPVLIYSGEITNKPITRRVHLPSEEVVIKESDIVLLTVLQ